MEENIIEMVPKKDFVKGAKALVKKIRPKRALAAIGGLALGGFLAYKWVTKNDNDSSEDELYEAEGPGEDDSEDEVGDDSE